MIIDINKNVINISEFLNKISFNITFDIFGDSMGSYRIVSGSIEIDKETTKIYIDKYLDAISDIGTDFLKKKQLANYQAIYMLETSLKNSFDKHWNIKDLYFMLNENGLIKIGVSNDPYRRVSDLKRTLSDEITIIKIVKDKGDLERILHRKFKHINVPYKGQREWFQPTEELKKFIEEI